MNVTINPGKLKGMVRVPGSKSAAHRALFCAAFADGKTLITGAGCSEDIQATLRAIEMLGAVSEEEDGGIIVTPVSLCGPDERRAFRLKMKQSGVSAEVRSFDCGESGTTYRFVLPLVGINGETTEIKMHGKLGERPVRELMRELAKKGMAFDMMRIKATAQGKLESGTFRLPGNVSSQFISALLTALPLVEGESRIEVEGPVSSEAYIEMTEDTVRMFGGKITREGNTFIVDPVSVYHSPGTVQVEGDWSSAAFWLTANALGSDIAVTGTDEASRQSDKAVTSLLPRILAGGSVIDVDACPDLLPVLSVAAAVSPGTTTFTGAGRLREKESDRLEASADMITALGGKALVQEDQLTVEGTGSEKGLGTLVGGTVNSCGDHRIAMSAAAAATVCSGPVTVTDAQSAAKSYPEFWNDYKALGGSLEEA